MDVSLVYIKICEKAVEIQKAWKPTGGDYYLHNYRGTTGFSPEMENIIWPDDEKFIKVEILCYQPTDTKDFWMYTNGTDSRVGSAQDLLKHHCIWLPRQDQLQEIYCQHKFGQERPINWVHCTLDAFQYAILDGDLVDSTFKMRSLEQLWLAFVMKTLYNKFWNGDDWK
jgi:hypothetical protein